MVELVRAIAMFFTKDIIKANEIALRVTWGTAIIGCPLLWVFWSPVAAILIAVIALTIGSAERKLIAVKELERHCNEKHDMFAKSEKIKEKYHEQAEEMPEEDRAIFLSQMDQFHVWMNEAFATTVELVAKDYPHEENKVSIVHRRWNRVIENLYDGPTQRNLVEIF